MKRILNAHGCVAFIDVDAAKRLGQLVVEPNQSPSKICVASQVGYDQPWALTKAHSECNWLVYLSSATISELDLLGWRLTVLAIDSELPTFLSDPLLPICPARANLMDGVDTRIEHITVTVAMESNYGFPAAFARSQRIRAILHECRRREIILTIVYA